MWLIPNNLSIEGTQMCKEPLLERVEKSLLHKSKLSSKKAWKTRIKKNSYFKDFLDKFFLHLMLEEYLEKSDCYFIKKKPLCFYLDGQCIPLKRKTKELTSLDSWKEKTKHIKKSYKEREEKSKKKFWSTPLSRDYKGHCSKESQERYKRHSLPEQAHSNTFLGKLNPRWVETLMGVPIGWTVPLCKEVGISSFSEESIELLGDWPTPTKTMVDINPSELKDKNGFPWKGVGRGYKNGIHRTITLQTVALAQKKSWSTPRVEMPQENPEVLVNKDGTVWDKKSTPYRKSGARVSYNVLLQAQLEIEKKVKQ